MNYNEIDKKHIWHPCSQMKDYEDYPAINIVRGEGVWLYKDNGQKILDAISSWWVNIFGHGNSYIAGKIKDQLDKLEHVIFANYTHEPAITLAHHLIGLFEEKLPKIFFTDIGSSAVEAAMKMSYQYWYNTGKPEKNRFAYITGAYHGETMGALSVGSLGTYKKVFEPILINTVEAPGPDCYRCPYNLDRGTCNAECFAETQKVLEKKHTGIAAILIEPMVQAANCMMIYSPVFLKKLRTLCTKLSIHLICDEIAVGFGRTGKMMASEHANIIPDFATVSKSITSGFLPLAAVLTSDQIYDAFYAPYTDMKAFMHSHTYTGNPLACAAANAVFELFEHTNILEKNVETGRYIREKINEIADHEHVGEIRSLGMIHAIELVKDKKTKQAFDWKKRLGYKIYRRAEKNGVLLRNLGDVIYFFPPYIISENEIDFMTGVALDSIKKELELLK